MAPFVLLTFLFLWLFSRTAWLGFVYLSFLCFCVSCGMCFFFRDPKRESPSGEDIILSPADGRIKAVTEVNKQTVVTIFLSLFDVHVNRVPVDGKVQRVAFKPGRFFAAFKDQAGQKNQRYEIEIITPRGTVIVHQIAGALARKVICWLQVGQTVKAGQKLGMIRFGSRVDLFLPEQSICLARVGQKVKAGLTVLGRLP